MAKINLYNLVVPAYYNLVRILIKLLNGDTDVPKTFTIGGSRKGGKTRAVLVLFAILYSLAFPGTMVVIATEKASGSDDTWKTLQDFIDKVCKVRAKVRSQKQGSTMEICFTNGSTIYVRSLRQSDSNKIALKGLPRPTDLKNAIIIEDECNTWPMDDEKDNNWFTVVTEAIVAENILNFRLFNTDHIKQPIVAYLQEHLPENESVMKSVGNMVKVEDVNGVLEYFQRTNTLVTWNVLPEATRKIIIAEDKANPRRGRVARWGLNGADGKVLYYNVKDKHFIDSSKLPKYERFYRLPHQLFVKYRIGLDEGHSNDKFATTLWGLTAQNRAIRLEKIVFTPPKNGDLDIVEVSQATALEIVKWSHLYPDMDSKMVSIRVEWAGNGVAVLQELKRQLSKTNINYTIDKAKKSIDAKTKKEVGSNKDTQPQLEARATIKNLLFGKNQLLFWNADEETKNEYTGRTRDNEGLIVDGDDHEGDADDYALIPKYDNMIKRPPHLTFAEELDEVIRKYRL